MKKYLFIQISEKFISAKLIFALIALFNFQIAFSQNVKIGATAAAPNASAILDLDGITGFTGPNGYKGILIPRMTFAQRTGIATLPAAAQGLLVYQTNVSGTSLEGFYYNTSLTTTPNWVFLDGKAGWEITGNTNVTNANFIGTPAAVDFITKTGGIAATNERMRVLGTGQTIINCVTAQAGDVFSVYADGYAGAINTLGPYAINGYTSSAGAGIYGENSLASNTGQAILGLNLSTVAGRGVSGGISSATGFGTEGYNLNASGTGLFGTGNGIGGLRLTAGSGGAFSGTSVGALGWGSVAATGTGLLGMGNGLLAYSVLAGGGGGSFNGTGNGSFSFATATNAIAVYGNANNATGVTTGVQGQVASTTDLSTGVFGVSTATTGATVGAWGQSASSGGRGVVGVGNTGLGAITLNSYGVNGEVRGTISGAAQAFGVYGFTNATITTGDARGVVGTTASNAGLGVFGSSASLTVAAGGTAGVWGQNLATTGLGYGVYGIASSTGGAAGVRGFNNTNITAISQSTYGVRGSANGSIAASTALNQSAAYGVRGDVLNAPGANSFATGVRGDGFGTSGSVYGIYGTSASATGAAISGYNAAAAGTGLIVAGNNPTLLQYLAVGSGGAFTGTQYGVAGFATTSPLTNGNNNAPANGAAAAAGGYFENQAGGVSKSWAYVGVTDNTGVNFKVIGNGAVGTMVKNEKGEYRGMTCPETPEVLFQDYGQGQLENGKAHIVIDNVLARNITVNEKHPLRVFIQLRGDCKGVYVTNETANGFDVIELQGGNSNTKFFWNITANRADEVTASGAKSPYSDYRFNAAPGPVSIKHEAVLRNNVENDIPTDNQFKTVEAGNGNSARPADSEATKIISVEAKNVDVNPPSLKQIKSKQTPEIKK